MWFRASLTCANTPASTPRLSTFDVLPQESRQWQHGNQSLGQCSKQLFLNGPLTYPNYFIACAFFVTFLVIRLSVSVDEACSASIQQDSLSSLQPVFFSRALSLRAKNWHQPVFTTITLDFAPRGSSMYFHSAVPASHFLQSVTCFLMADRWSTCLPRLGVYLCTFRLTFTPLRRLVCLPATR